MFAHAKLTTKMPVCCYAVARVFWEVARWNALQASRIVWSQDMTVGVRVFTILNNKQRNYFSIDNITHITFQQTWFQRPGFHILLTVRVSWPCIRALEHRNFNVRRAQLQFVKLNKRRKTEEENLIAIVKQSCQGSSEIRKKAFQLHNSKSCMLEQKQAR